MPKHLNALVPVPANALYERAQAYPEFQELSQFLTSRRGALPPVEYAPLYGASGEYDPRTGKLKLAERMAYGTGKEAEDTVIHELTHSAVNELHGKYMQAKGLTRKTPEIQQFIDGYEKLMVAPGMKFQQAELAKRMAPDWAAANANYRASASELPAWAMGLSATGRNDGYEAPPHVNPTLATDFRILLDLANRAKIK
jgi:hypothetical protein